MTYLLRLTCPDKHTTISDDMVELVNPTRKELSEVLRLFLSRGRVSCLVSRDDGGLRFFSHDLCFHLADMLIGG